MSDYISREALIDKVERHYCDPCKGQGVDLGGDWCRSCVINSVLEKVRGIPAADMLEKLAAEKDAQKPERISVEDRPPEKKHEAYLCSLGSCLLSGGQYIDDIRVFYGDGKWGERPGHSLDAAAGAAEGGHP